MSRAPSKAHSLTMKAAALAAQLDDEDEGPSAAVAEAADPVVPVVEPAEGESASQTKPAEAPRGRGRPKGKRAVEARHTVYLDAPRHSALSRLAEDRGRSVHSLILEGIDHVIGKPQNPGWQGR